MYALFNYIPSSYGLLDVVLVNYSFKARESGAGEWQFDEEWEVPITPSDNPKLTATVPWAESDCLTLEREGELNGTKWDIEWYARYEDPFLGRWESYWLYTGVPPSVSDSVQGRPAT